MKIASFITLLLLTSCATLPPVQTGGEGAMKNGEALIGEASLGYDGNNMLTIINPKGWTCTAYYKKDTTTAIRRFPLNCDNNISGNAVMSVNPVQHKATVAFSLENGESGTVSFGIVN